MRRLLVIFGSAVLVLVAVLLGVPSLIPASAVKAELEAYVQQNTGRRLAISGDGHFRILPAAGVTFEGVQLSGPDGDARRPFLRADTVTAELSLLSLIGGGVAFEALTLDNAIIDLRTDAAGNVNWQFGAPAQPEPETRLAYAAPAMAAPTRLSIRRVSLRNSTIRYHTPDNRVPIEASDATLSLRMPDPSEVATLSGTFSARGRAVEIDATLDSPQRLDLGEQARLTATISSAFAELRLDGRVSPDRQVTGALTAESDQPAEVFAVAGTNLAPILETVRVQGTLDASADRIGLSDLKATLNNMTGRGNIAVSMTRPRPALSGRLEFDRLDLEALRLRPVAQDRADNRVPGLWPAHAASGDGARLDLSALDAFDAELALSADRLSRKALTARDAAASARLKGGALRIDLSRVRLYDGTASGTAEVSAHDSVPVISATMDVQDVNALPLFSDASSFDWLSGKLRGRIRVASGGATLEELRARLQGDAEMSLREGALQGLDLPAALGRLQSGDISEFRRRSGEETRFVRLNANWAIRKGIARTDDLRLEGPFVNADGTGKVDVRRERLDFKLRPRITSRSGDSQPIELPIRIKGGWDNPTILPDVEQVLKDPEKSLGAAKNFGKAVEKLTGGGVSEDDFKNAIEGFLGQND
jgi:AsmA protein